MGKHGKKYLTAAKLVYLTNVEGLYRDWPVSKGCTPPYVPVWVEAMVKRQG